MEIHAPEGQVHSFRDFTIHLAIVTAGILIALGLEQTVEWRHHRELAAEARANILSEIRDNRKGLASLLGNAPGTRRNHLSAIRLIDRYLAHETSADNQMDLGVGIAEIRDTAWTTAQTVGALNYMPYGEVQKFASAYRLQQQFERLQDRAIDAVVTSEAVFAEGQDPAQLSKADLALERERLLDSLAQIVAETQLAEGLEKTYADVLGGGKRAD